MGWGFTARRARCISACTVALLAAGCGTKTVTTTVTTPAGSANTTPLNQQRTTTATVSSQPTQTTVSAPPSTAIGSPVGEFIGIGKGTRYTQTYTATPLMYGYKKQTPPVAALDVCNANYTESIAQDVYIGGTDILDYAKGIMALTFIPIGDNIVTSIDTQVLPSPPDEYAIEVDGQWECPAQNQDPGSGGFTVQPGQTVTLNFWVIMSGLVDNADPVVPKKQAEMMSLDIPFDTSQSVSGGKVVGPHAAKCADTGGYELLPYATLPFASERCKPV
jgi:hypothetical protein